MSEYPQPLSGFELGPFNPYYFEVWKQTLTLESADARYLKKTGGLITGSLIIQGELDVGSLSIGGVSADLTFITGIAAGTASPSKALVVDSSRDITNINSLTASTLLTTNLTLGSTTITEGEIALIDGLTAGTATASKALIVDSSRNIANLNTISATGSLRLTSTNTSFPDTSFSSAYNLSITNQDTTLADQCGIAFLCATQSITTTTPTASIRAFRSGNNGAGGIEFATRSSTTQTAACVERMRITAAGLVGIGNSNPSYQLDVAGGIRSEGDSVITGSLTLSSLRASVSDIEIVGSNLVMQTGHYNLDDSATIKFWRDYNAANLNSSIYCSNAQNLTISSVRGSGSILMETNRFGITSSSYSYCFTDGTTTVGSVTTRRGIMNLYQNRTVQMGSISETTTMYSNPYWTLATTNGIRTHGVYVDSDSFGASAFYQPKYEWNLQNGNQGNDGSSQGGIGPHDSVGNRTRIGIATFLSTPDVNSVCLKWDSSGTGLSMYAGSWNTTSDIRIKTDITSIDYDLQTIMQLNPVRYQLKYQPEEGYHLGLIAQEVLPIIPECVSTSGEDNDREDSPIMMSIEYTQLIALLIKGIQQLNAKVIDLESKTT